MSNIFVDGFGTYGQAGENATQDELNAVHAALLSGVYATTSINAQVAPLPWDTANPDLYTSNAGQGDPLRKVLPAALTTLMVSMYYAVDILPSGNDVGNVISFRDAGNTIRAQLICQSTGALVLENKDNGVLASTGGPVIVAETQVHLEMQLTTAGVFKLNVNGVAVINVTGLTFTGTGAIAQLGFIQGTTFPLPTRRQFVSHLIVRDTNGGVNDTFPIGDRRVATLFPNSDDVAHQGWTPQPRHRFGTGILYVPGATSDACATAASSNSLDIGPDDFTIETQIRFAVLPALSAKQVIFGKWDELHNRRSYQLYKGGPSLEAGNLVFRISTDGMAGTVVEIVSWPWAPDTDTWYHVAISRAAGETMLFINGVQQGLAITDANTYLEGSIATTALGGQDDTNNSVDASLNGWLDEFRFTVGVARYTTDFTPPSAPFPRGSLADPDWSSVTWLSGFDSGLFDESSYGRTLSNRNGVAVQTPDDGAFAYQTINKPAPLDDTFIEAALIPASGILTQTVQPANNATTTVGTTAVATPAVYTWKTALTGAAFEVLRGANLAAALFNFISAVNHAAGEGTLYGTGTTANFDVAANALPTNQVEVVANTPGTGGNAIATSTTDVNGSWTGATLSGGADIPGYSQFGFQRPPNHTTIVDSFTIIHRDFKTDAGAANVQASMVGVAGGVLTGANNPITTTPTIYADTFEADPDGGGLTPTTVVGARVRMNRTA